MAAKIDQKAYLKKYLTGSSGDKKKKKKKVVKSNKLKIIDDDLDVSKLRALDGDELDILDQGEDGPQIAGIIDERPEEVKKLEQFKTNSKWRVISQDDGFNSKLQVEEIKKDVKEQEKDNEVIFGKMYSDSEDEQKKDSDTSPPRKSKALGGHEPSKKPQNHSDSDVSPPRKGRPKDSDRKSKHNKGSDSDQSPPRKYERAEKSYKNASCKETKDRRNSNDSDLSPPRRNEDRKNKEDRNNKERRKKSRWGTFEAEFRADYLQRNQTMKPNKSPSRPGSHSSDLSPPRKSQKVDKRSKIYDSDILPRKSRRDSPKRNKRQKSHDSDASLPHKQRSNKYNLKNSKNDTDSDLSPPRKGRKESPPRNRRKSPDSDPSPPRKYRKASPPRSRGKSPDSDSSPPRKSRKRSPEKVQYHRSSNSPPPSNKNMAKTLDGKLAGLQDARQLRDENEAFRRRDNEAFSRLNDEVSGRNAQVVSRKISKRETSEERRKQLDKAEKQKELDDKYKKWSKGLKQVEDQQARAQDFLHEAAKPLARHKDDKDLERSLKQVERDGDPMLQYMRERKRERGELGPEKPTYKGNCPPNRFNIRPGYRWDGVDRSNGYENKYFETQSKKKAQAEEYHKWSSADL